MSPHKLPQTREQAERMIRDGVAALAALQERETSRHAARLIEPVGDGKVVRFDHRFAKDGKLYTYAAIRASNPRGARRWYITSADYLSGRGHQGLTSPATWVDLVEFAEPGTIRVAWEWDTIGELPNETTPRRTLPPTLDPLFAGLFHGRFRGHDHDDDHGIYDDRPRD
jgi:hypothetical protein